MSTQPLKKCAHALQACVPARSRSTADLPNRVSERKFAEELSAIFQEWDDVSHHVLAVAGVDPWKGASVLPLSRRYEDWLQVGGAQDRYGPVHELQNIVSRSAAHFLRAIVHGSVGTLDDQEGFSDLDLAFVVRASSLKSVEGLLDLRRLSMNVIFQMLQFDPHMHHGPHFITEMDLVSYPEPLLPIPVMRCGVTLLSTQPAQKVRPHDSAAWTEHQMDVFEEFFRNRVRNNRRIENAFDVEWVLGSCMLLPALFLQRLTGIHRYKRDTFSAAADYFDPVTWGPVVTASTLRSTLSARPRPSTSYVKACRSLGWPGGIRLWSRFAFSSRSYGRRVDRMVGDDYCQQVLTLIRAMRERATERPTQ